VRTPDWTFSLGGSYRAEIGGGWSLTPSVAASYRSQQEVATSNLSFFTGTITGTNGTFPNNPNGGTFITGSRSPAAWLVNASLTLAMPDDRLTISAECTNCFDEVYAQSALGNYQYLNPPTTWTIRARYNF
jgi:iron complex outermembrane recepter protein